MEILSQIQADLLDSKIPLSGILRKAKVLASQLSSDELDSWVSQELDGYKDQNELPDYRVLSTSVSGTWTNGFHTLHYRGVPLYSIKNEKLREHLTKFHVRQGVRSIEEFTKLAEDRKLALAADVTAYVNSLVGENGYGYTHLYYSVDAGNFEQILDTVQNRLLDFILKLGKQWNPKKDPPSEDEIDRLVSVIIYNNPQGGTVTVFDQRGQHVEYQFNAAGNINIEQVETTTQLSKEIEKLREEIARAKQSGVVSEEIAIEAQYHMLEASREVTSKEPNKSKLLEHIGKVKELLKDISALAGLVTGLVKLIEVAAKLFN